MRNNERYFKSLIMGVISLKSIGLLIWRNYCNGDISFVDYIYRSPSSTVEQALNTF